MTPRIQGRQTMRYIIAGGSIITLMTASFMYVYFSSNKESKGNTIQHNTELLIGVSGITTDAPENNADTANFSNKAEINFTEFSADQPGHN